MLAQVIVYGCVPPDTTIPDILPFDSELGECLNVFTKVNTKAVNRKGLEDSMVLMRGSKDPQSVYIAERVDQADGKTVAEAMAKVVNQVHGSYRIADILYDIARGYLLDPRS